MPKLNEDATCRGFVVPRLVEAGWAAAPGSFQEQWTFTDGRIIPLAQGYRRGRGKRADYLLRYGRDLPLAVVEAKAAYKSVGTGMQQAKDYAEILGVQFAYATNGVEILEFDFGTGVERRLDTFPGPEELYARLAASEGYGEQEEASLLEPYNLDQGKKPRYYQDLAIRASVSAVARGDKRVLLTMATGTGKTSTAFQICWKLWRSGWNGAGERRRPRILYLADRTILVDDPMNRDFAAFGDAVVKIEDGSVPRSREIYFATYQAIAGDSRRERLFLAMEPNFFDLIIVDECHRGSARPEGNWREILEHFSSATQLGMTATPLRDDNRDTYAYFGNPVYSYSLRQGIQDGFLAPYRLQRIITSADAAGWRPTKGELDRYGRAIPDDEYETADFERVVALRARTATIARHLTRHLEATDRMAKTIVFCVDQEHADEMRRELANLNSDLVRRMPNYVCRVTSDEGDIGRGHLSRFQDIEAEDPVILTTSQLLTTGVDAPTVKNIAIVRVVSSMSEFKQIIGRGTRVREDYGKYEFTILDYTGSASRNFADPAFDGEPARLEEVRIDDDGVVESREVISEEQPLLSDEDGGEDTPDVGNDSASDADEGGPRKYYVDGGVVEVAHELVYELDADGRQLRVMQFVDYTGERVRNLCRSEEDLRTRWLDWNSRTDLLEELLDSGIDFERLGDLFDVPDADPFDLLCHAAFNSPIRTRRQRADRLLADESDFFEQFGEGARDVLKQLLANYAEHGVNELRLPDALKLAPISDRGNAVEIAALFGGAKDLRRAVEQMQTALYAA